MKVFKVNSLPLKDVIISLSKSFEVDYKESCDEYWLDIPSSYGKGQIRGVNFDNGLGVIVYDCCFRMDLRIEFTVDDVHPVKYIYSVEGKIQHTFANERENHSIEKYQCVIVASKQRNGHVLQFYKNLNNKIVSLEIDRYRFINSTSCEIDSLVPELCDLFRDTKAEKTYYHEGYYGLQFREIFDNINRYQDRALARKFYLESIALNVFVNQLVEFEDDMLTEDNREVLRQNEVDAAEKLTEYIKHNSDKKLSIEHLSKKSGLNSNKLQKLFKYLYNTTVNNYINDRRLDKAMELLQDTNLNISEIALKTGFNNNSYFSKIFKKKLGVSPSVFRR